MAEVAYKVGVSIMKDETKCELLNLIASLERTKENIINYDTHSAINRINYMQDKIKNIVENN